MRCTGSAASTAATCKTEFRYLGEEMVRPAEDAYSGLQVTAAKISTLSDADLSSLFSELLRSQAHRAGVSPDQAYVNAEDKAKDDGCDAWLGAARVPDAWSGPEDTCWQLKAGV